MLAAVVLAATLSADATCPSRDQILKRVESHDLSRASRLDRFGQEIPGKLHLKAATRPGRAIARRRGLHGFGAIVVDLAVERLWKAISDEEHFDLEGFLPVERSDVIEGNPRGARRMLLQTFDRLGIGRWWVSEVNVNGELFSQSGGRLWETYWQDRMSEVDPSLPPVSEVSGDLSPLREGHGAWLLVPVAEECTLVDYYVHADPGGIVGAFHLLMLKGAIRSTLTGVVRMAEDHVDHVHPEERFLRPDGTPIR